MAARAFSVVELIVVIAMLGLVIAVGAPAFLRDRAISGARTCQENLARLQGAVEGYRLEHSITGAPNIAVDDLVDTTGTGVIASVPHCPAGGHYSVDNGKARCSIGPNSAATYAPHIYSTELPFVKGDK